MKLIKYFLVAIISLSTNNVFCAAGEISKLIAPNIQDANAIARNTLQKSLTPNEIAKKTAEQAIAIQNEIKYITNDELLKKLPQINSKLKDVVLEQVKITKPDISTDDLDLLRNHLDANYTDDAVIKSITSNRNSVLNGLDNIHKDMQRTIEYSGIEKFSSTELETLHQLPTNLFASNKDFILTPDEAFRARDFANKAGERAKASGYELQPNNIKRIESNLRTLMPYVKNSHSEGAAFNILQKQADGFLNKEVGEIIKTRIDAKKTDDFKAISDVEKKSLGGKFKDWAKETWTEFKNIFTHKTDVKAGALPNFIHIDPHTGAQFHELIPGDLPYIKPGGFLEDLNKPQSAAESEIGDAYHTSSHNESIIN